MEPEKPSRESIEQAKTSARRIMRKSTILTLSIMLGLVAISVAIINTSVSPLSRFASVNKQRGVVPIQLHAFLKHVDGKLLELQSKAKLGDLIAFKLSTTRPVHTGLAVSINKQKPYIVFKGARIPPGPNRLLEKEDYFFSYEVKPSDKDVKFCLITSDDHERLYDKLRRLQSIWTKIDDAACVQVI